MNHCTPLIISCPLAPLVDNNTGLYKTRHAYMWVAPRFSLDSALWNTIFTSIFLGLYLWTLINSNEIEIFFYSITKFLVKETKTYGRVIKGSCSEWHYATWIRIWLKFFMERRSRAHSQYILSRIVGQDWNPLGLGIFAGCIYEIFYNCGLLVRKFFGC